MSPIVFAQAQPANGTYLVITLLVLFLAVILLFAFILFAKYFNLWIQAKTTHANVALLELIGMTFRKVNPNIIVRSKIMAIQAGLTEKDGVTTRSLEAHYLAGGNVPNAVGALSAATPRIFPP